MVHAGQPAFGRRRIVRRERRPLRRRDSETFDLFGIGQRQQRKNGVDHQLNMAAGDIVQRRRGAAIRLNQQVQPREAVEFELRQMAGRAERRRSQMSICPEPCALRR